MLVLPLVAPIIISAVGLSVTAVQVRVLARARATKSWVRCTGTIVGAVPGAHFEAGPRGTPWPRALARIRYHYSVNDHSYEGNRVSLSGPPPELWGSSSIYAAALLERYHIGAEVGVWYNPSDPTQAVLEGGANRSNYWGVAAGLALLLIGLLWLVEAVAA